MTLRVKEKQVLKKTVNFGIFLKSNIYVLSILNEIFLTKMVVSEPDINICIYIYTYRRVNGIYEYIYIHNS